MGTQGVIPVAFTADVERDIANDLARRGVVIAPVVIGALWLARGNHGAASAAIAVAIVLVNFLVAAAIMTRAGKLGATAVGVGALVGYVVRMVVVVVAVVALRHRSFIDLPVLAFVLLGTHLGLLFWEMKYLSITLAAPALRPGRPGLFGDK